MWAKRFGPTIVGTVETNEAANKESGGISPYQIVKQG
jgi:hypothetical protein